MLTSAASILSIGHRSLTTECPQAGGTVTSGPPTVELAAAHTAKAQQLLAQIARQHAQIDTVSTELKLLAEQNTRLLQEQNHEHEQEHSRSRNAPRSENPTLSLIMEYGSIYGI